LAFLGYSVLNIAQAGQKIGLQLKNDRALAGWSLWTAATVGTLLAVFIVLIALSLGAVSLVGAMAGSGLATLAVFSHFVMGESITKMDLVGIVVILAGSVLIGFFASQQGEPSPRWFWLHGFSIALILAYTVAWVFVGEGKRAGLVLGGFGGALAGSSMLYQNATTLTADLGALVEFPLRDNVSAERLLQLVNPYLFIWLTLSMAGFFVLQIAYGRGKAIHVIPSFNVNFIVVPVVGGVVAFSEAVHPLQWVGVVIIIVGTLLLTARPEPVEKALS
jgi:drug/metabolite transporter (DMT)-like permease